jgi:hypothetical protein
VGIKAGLVGKLDNLCNNLGGNQFNISRVASKEVQTRVLIANANANEDENGKAKRRLPQFKIQPVW